MLVNFYIATYLIESRVSNSVRSIALKASLTSKCMTETPVVYKEEMSQVFVVIYGILLFSQKKIDLRMQNSV